MRVFQVGASGNVGLRLSRLLVDAGHSVTGMHRSPEQAEKISATGATPVQEDLIEASIEGLAQLFADHDAVVFSAGAHGTGREKTTQIDGVGLQKSVDAAKAAGALRFVLVSAFPESERAEGLGEGFEHYMRTKKTADVYLARSGLDWVIVRPGLLTEEKGNGLVTSGPAIPYGNVSRDNVAAFINALVPDPEINKVIIELTDGATPVVDAMAALHALC